MISLKFHYFKSFPFFHHSRSHQLCPKNLCPFKTDIPNLWNQPSMSLVSDTWLTIGGFQGSNFETGRHTYIVLDPKKNYTIIPIYSIILITEIRVSWHWNLLPFSLTRVPSFRVWYDWETRVWRSEVFDILLFKDEKFDRYDIIKQYHRVRMILLF